MLKAILLHLRGGHGAEWNSKLPVGWEGRKEFFEMWSHLLTRRGVSCIEAEEI
jgi:hypothetical protein